MRCSEPPVLMLGPGGAFTVAFHEDPTSHLLPRLQRCPSSWEPGVNTAGDVLSPAASSSRLLSQSDPTGRLLALAGCLAVAERALARQSGFLAHTRVLLAGLGRRLVGGVAVQWSMVAPGVAGRLPRAF